MRVRVVDTFVAGGRSYARITSDYGNVVAQWMSKLPVLCGEIDVEFNIVETLEWGRNLIVGDAPRFSMSTVAEGIRICGTIEDIQDDGVAAIRVGSALILVETIGKPPTVGAAICMTVKELQAFDSNI
jgi:hypothetical protein